jgi:hypothetical protein
MTRRNLILSAMPPSLVAADTPRPAPDISVSLPDGRQLRLADYRGKVVSFAFILTT